MISKINFIFRIILTILVVSYFAFLNISSGFSQTSTLKDLQKEKAKLQAEIEAKRKETERKKKEAETLKRVIIGLNNDINATERKIADTQKQIEGTQNQIVETENQIQIKKEELKKQLANQAELLRVIYETENRGLLFLVLGSNSLSEVITHNEYLEALELRIEVLIAEINKLKAELEATKVDLENKKQQLQNLRGRLENYGKALEKQKEQKNETLADTQTAIKDLQSQIEEAKQRQTEVDAALAKLFSGRRGLVKARDKGTSAVGFAWPIDYIYISQDYDDPWVFNPSVAHGGLDLVNAEGTSIYAAASGTAEIGSFRDPNGHYYGYGNYVIIYHNARFASLYGHLSGFAVVSDQEVKQGDLIGYVGNTGWSTGPHLHFEIREYGARVDPISYLP